MRSATLEQRWYRQPDSERRSPESGLWAQVKRAWTQMTAALSTSNEPKIWTTTDRRGRVYWYARDPMSGRKLAHASEHDVRVWLEQRYYN